MSSDTPNYPGTPDSSHDTPTPPPAQRDAGKDLAVCEAATPGPWMRYGYIGEADLRRLRFQAGTCERTGRVIYQDVDLQRVENVKFIGIARRALPHWITRATAAEQEVERLRAEVHDCPKCGMACKQCQCYEQEVAELRARLAVAEQSMKRHYCPSCKTECFERAGQCRGCGERCYTLDVSRLLKHDAQYREACEAISGATMCAVDGDNLCQLVSVVLDKLAAAERERDAAKSKADQANGWRQTINAICGMVGHPPISPDEGHTMSVAESVQRRMAEFDRMQEELEHRTVDPLAELSASLEHHDEHHRLEEELKAENARLTAALQAAQGRVRELEEASRPFAKVGANDTAPDTWSVYVELRDCRRVAEILGEDKTNDTR